MCADQLNQSKKWGIEGEKKDPASTFEDAILI